MELFGEKLKEARETKGYSVEQIARETKISRHFIVALENEEFASFPSETYLIGFLKNYADFLSLDPDRLVTLYRNFKIQEQPIPMDELLNMKKKISPLLITIFSILGLGVLAGIGVVLFTFVLNPQTQTNLANTIKERAVSENNNIVSKEEYLFKEELITRIFHVGNLIRFPMKETDYIFTIKEISDKLSLLYNNELMNLTLAEEKYLDMDQDNKYDLKITFADIVNSDKGNEAKLILEKITVAKVALSENENPPNKNENPIENTITSHSKYRLKNDGIVLFESDKIGSFNVNIKFQNYCLFRFLVDNKLKEQRYFYNDDTLNLPVNKEAVFWMSNADAVNLTINGVVSKLGKPGEVKTKLVHWIQNDLSKKFKLEIVSIY